MNTLGYLQFFDRLAEKKRASFSMEHISSQLAIQSTDGQDYTHRCTFIVGKQQVQTQGSSRKSALIALYKLLH